MATAEFTSCSGGRAGGRIINAFTDSTASRSCPCVSNAHAGINRHNADSPSLRGCIRIMSGGMDFVSDALFDGRRLRLLTVIDLFTRECLGICVSQNLRSTEVTEMLNTIALRRPLPQLLKTDNGSEFAGKMLDKWVYERGIRIDFSRPGTPTDNATVESFNGWLRQECLNANWFISLEDTRCKIEAWRIHYFQRRSHSALGWMTPSEFAEKSASWQNMQPT